MKKYIILSFIISSSIYSENNILNLIKYAQDEKELVTLPKVPLLHAGILSEDLSLVENALLYEPYTLNYKGVCGNTPLHLAVLKNNVEIISLLIREGAEINGINQNGDPPLFFAVKNNSPLALIEYLIIRGADATMINKDNLSVLDVALECGRRDVQYYLYSNNIQKRPVLLTNIIDTTNMIQITNLFTNTIHQTNIIDSSNTLEFLNVITRTNLIYHTNTTDITNNVYQTNTTDTTNNLSEQESSMVLPKVDTQETNNLSNQIFSNDFVFFEAV
ncbi:MAG: ankyrin repeat domain-containing protein [Brevinema sp.]